MVHGFTNGGRMVEKLTCARGYGSAPPVPVITRMAHVMLASAWEAIFPLAEKRASGVVGERGGQHHEACFPVRNDNKLSEAAHQPHRPVREGHSRPPAFQHTCCAQQTHQLDEPKHAYDSQQREVTECSVAARRLKRENFKNQGRLRDEVDRKPGCQVMPNDSAMLLYPEYPILVGEKELHHHVNEKDSVQQTVDDEPSIDHRWRHNFVAKLVAEEIIRIQG
eukprot:2587018-Prymnesium_polylepis.2